MNLFQLGTFTLHSGKSSSFKIECDALTKEDWKTLAKMVSEKYTFSFVHGVPTGGLQFADALCYYATGDPKDPVLIADDVLTTGGSMEEARAEIPESTIGVVVFARGKCPDWIHPIFQLW